MAVEVGVETDVAVGVTVDTEGSDEVEDVNGIWFLATRRLVAFTQVFCRWSNMAIGSLVDPPVITTSPLADSAKEYADRCTVGARELLYVGQSLTVRSLLLFLDGGPPTALPTGAGLLSAPSQRAYLVTVFGVTPKL